MPWCENCGKKNPSEKDYVFEGYVGEYFCSEECRNNRRIGEEKIGGF